MGTPSSLFKGFVSGAKRGFSNAIDQSGKWVFSVNGGFEVDLGKGIFLWLLHYTN